MTGVLVMAIATGGATNGNRASHLLEPEYGRAVVANVSDQAAKCHAHKGLKFYVRRYAEHAAKMGAGRGGLTESERRPPSESRAGRELSCPLYLAKVWKRKAFAMRQRYERWWAQRGQVIRRLERGVRGTPMAGTGVILERHGRRYGVSPYFIVAVAATESSIGHAACSSNRFNVWGLSSCGSGWYVPQFRSWDEAILFFVRFIDRRFQGHSTPYSFRGYAACSDCWARKVSEWMGRLFGVAARTAYP